MRKGLRTIARNTGARRGPSRKRSRAVLGATALVVALGVLVEPVAPVPTAEAASGPSTPTLTATQLVGSIGVNVHESYLDSVYVDAHGPGPTLAALQQLGVKRVRIGLAKRPRSYVGPFLSRLHERGISIMAIVGTPSGSWGTYRTGESGLLKKALTSGYLRGKLALLEMPNEWDGNGGSTWRADLQAFTTEYARAIEQVPGHPPIVAPAMARPEGYAASQLRKVADVANTHPYAGDQMPESKLVLPLWVGPAEEAAKKQRVIASEIGWQTAPRAPRRVSEKVGAHYLIRSLIWNRTHGIDQSYVYELFDQRPDPAGTEPELHYGLVAVTGDPAQRSTWRQRPKAAFTELKRTIARLRDTGRKPTRRFGYTFRAAPRDLFSTPILRRDGAEDVAVWRRVALPSAGGGVSSTRMVFTRPMRVEVFNPATGRTTLLSRSTKSQVVRVSGVVRIVRIRPAG